MMTPDKDYGQLVNDNVFIYKPKYGDKEFEIMGIEAVKAKIQYWIANSSYWHIRLDGRRFG